MRSTLLAWLAQTGYAQRSHMAGACACRVPLPHVVNVLQAMTDLADFVVTRTRAGARPLLAEAVKEQSKLLQLLQWQAAVLMERAFWSLSKSLQPAANTPGRSSASKASLWHVICVLSARAALSLGIVLAGG